MKIFLWDCSWCNIFPHSKLFPVCLKPYPCMVFLSSTHDALSVILRSTPDGNCLYNAVSIVLVENESLAYNLRVLTSIELFENNSFYANHSYFKDAVKKTWVQFRIKKHAISNVSLSLNFVYV